MAKPLLHAINDRKETCICICISIVAEKGMLDFLAAKLECSMLFHYSGVKFRRRVVDISHIKSY